jgi:hypothetical protein
MMSTQRCWFQKGGEDITEGINVRCKFKSPGNLEIYDVLHNGEVIGEIYAGYPQNMVDGYSFRLEDVYDA